MKVFGHCSRPATVCYNFDMVTISADEMQKDFSGYLRLVQRGETLIITQADEPVAEVKPVAWIEQEPRPFGLCAGEFVTPDDFDAPLPDDVLGTYEVLRYNNDYPDHY